MKKKTDLTSKKTLGMLSAKLPKNWRLSEAHCVQTQTSTVAAAVLTTKWWTKATRNFLAANYFVTGKNTKTMNTNTSLKGKGWQLSAQPSRTSLFL